MRVLVTGGAGYIGSITSRRLLAAGHDVVVVDDLSTGHRDAVPAAAAFHQMSIADLAAPLPDWGIEAIVHFAASALVAESMTDPSAYWWNNTVGVLRLLDAACDAGVKRVVVSSTSATYGDPVEVPMDESSPTRPTSPYGSSKLAADLALTDFAAAYGLVAVSLRYFNVAGALITDGDAAGERHATETHLVPLALDAALGQRESLTIFGTDYPTPDGTCVRDYIHVVDLAEAHVAALRLGDAGEHHIVNLGSGVGYSVQQVVTTVQEVTGRRVPVVRAERRPGDPAVTLASNTRAYELLGWQPERDLGRMVSDAWQFRNRHG